MQQIDKKQQEKINTIAVLMDVIDQYLAELKPEFKNGMKQLINRAYVHTNALIREFDRIFSEENRENFGDTADMLREFIEQKLLKDE